MSKILSSKQIGDKLRMFRLQAGWSQERLSEQIGVSPQQFQKYETGRNMMNTHPRFGSICVIDFAGEFRE